MKKFQMILAALLFASVVSAAEYSEESLFEGAMNGDAAIVDYLRTNCNVFTDLSKYDALIEKGYTFMNLGAALYCEDSREWNKAMLYLISGASNDDLGCNRELVKAYGSFHNDRFFPNVSDNRSERQKWNLRASEQGCVEGMYDYATSILVAESDNSEKVAEAMGYLSQAAGYGCYDAKVALIGEYFYGNNVERDLDAALALALDLNNMNPGDNWVLQQLAYINDALGNYTEAYAYMREALVDNADKLSTTSFMFLADYNFSGKAGKVNFNKAYDYYREYLARYEQNGSDDEENLSKVYFQLGYMYMAGEGVAVSGKDSFACFEKSALLGNVDGQNSLAMCYYEGIGTAQDLTEAVCWFSKAASNGDVYSSEMLAEIFSDSSANLASVASAAGRNASSTLASL